MKTIEDDIEIINKFVNTLSYAGDCILDIRVRIEHEGFESNEKILEEIGRAHDFLTDAENYLKLTMEE